MPVTSIIRGLGGFGTKEEIYGRKVVVPDYPELDAAQRQAVKADRAIIPDVEDLAREVNTMNAAEIERLLKSIIPDLGQINTNVSETIASWTRGEPGSGVENLIARKSAERAVAGGFGGSGMHRNLEARDLGLTSLQVFEKGMASAERWVASVLNTQAPAFDVTSMFISPAQQFSANEAKWQRDLYAETMAAAPNPAARGAFDSEMELIGMVLSAYGGGSGYKQSYAREEAEPPDRDPADRQGMTWWQSFKASRAAAPNYDTPNGGWIDPDKRKFV
jgi:hypothetical protein